MSTITCPNCGFANIRERTQCKQCGASLANAKQQISSNLTERAQTVLPQGQPVELVGNTKPFLVYCISCGMQITSNSRFCPSCGEPQPMEDSIEISLRERFLAAAVHLSGLLVFLVPATNIIVPYYFYRYHSSSSPFLRLNYQYCYKHNVRITILLAIAVVLTLLLIGGFMIVIASILHVIFMIFAAGASMLGRVFKYPTLKIKYPKRK